MKKSPIYCNHANEMPARCPCDDDCYCKENSCKPQLPWGRETVKKLQEWLGEDGIKFFREVKEKYGRVDACWVEGEESFGSETSFAKAIKSAQHPPIPHPVHFREGMQVRNFLRTIYGESWTCEEYDNRWVPLVESAIRTSLQ